jgi:integrase
MNKPSKYKRLSPLWIESIRPSKSNDLQSEIIEREYYTLDEVRQLVNFKPVRFVDERDRAAVAMLFLSGIRVGAFVTLPVSCIDIENMVIHQLPSAGVETKNSKAAKTFLLPIDDLLEIVREWDKRIRSELGEDSLWYPNLTTDGMKWKYAPVGSTESRRVAFARALKRFCNRVGIDYKSPHKLRNGHGVYGIKKVKTTEEFKAFSQNMSHKSMEITDSLYGELASNDVRNVILGMSEKDEKGGNDEMDEMFKAFNIWLKSQN